MKYARTIVSVFIFLVAVTPICQSEDSHIVSIDLVAPTVTLTEIIIGVIQDTAVSGFSIMLSYQYTNNSLTDYCFKLGLLQQTYNGENMFVLKHGQEYRFFPFRQSPIGFFIGPMFDGRLQVFASSAIQDRGDLYFYTGIGPIVGYQFTKERLVFSVEFGWMFGFAGELTNSSGFKWQYFNSDASTSGVYIGLRL